MLQNNYINNAKATPKVKIKLLLIKLDENSWKIYFQLQSLPSAEKFIPLTHFSPMSHFYTPRKRQKTIGFLTFSGGIEKLHWTKMDYSDRSNTEFIIVINAKKSVFSMFHLHQKPIARK